MAWVINDFINRVCINDGIIYGSMNLEDVKLSSRKLKPEIWNGEKRIQRKLKWRKKNPGKIEIGKKESKENWVKGKMSKRKKHSKKIKYIEMRPKQLIRRGNFNITSLQF